LIKSIKAQTRLLRFVAQLSISCGFVVQLDCNQSQTNRRNTQLYSSNGSTNKTG